MGREVPGTRQRRLARASVQREMARPTLRRRRSRLDTTQPLRLPQPDRAHRRHQLLGGDVRVRRRRRRAATAPSPARRNPTNGGGGMTWRNRAACLGVDSDLFFPPPGPYGAEEAKAICRDCPVRAECLDYAVTTAQK